MEPLIRGLKSTAFFGQRLTRRKIAGIQETVRGLPRLSRHRTGAHDLRASALEDAQGPQPHPAGHAPAGGSRAPRHPGPGRQAGSRPRLDGRTARQPAVEGPLADLAPLKLEAATEPEEAAEWNQWVKRYHRRGYRQPVGPHLRHFLLDRFERKPGCLLFSYASPR